MADSQLFCKYSSHGRRQWDVGGGALVEEQAGLDLNTDITDPNSWP